uniref:Triacylglycerol lipase n=1 Tax=Bursaphelenchus xylophilus TaxID=6326 RepID=A0A1I7SHI6_BURXY
MSFIASWIIALLFTTTAKATFTFGFQQFLIKTYGADIAKNLTRLDWGVRGSFGGGNWTSPRKTQNTPVVVVHGLGNVMGDYHELRAEFFNRGYRDDEIYGTTYGLISKQIGIDETIECQFVKQVKQLGVGHFADISIRGHPTRGHGLPYSRTPNSRTPYSRT